jgi:DNA-binding LytR/AlgR family response regulator
VAVLPWLFVFETIKHVEHQRGILGWGVIAGFLTATAIASLLLEHAVDRLVWNSASSPVALSLLRRLPAIGIVILFVLLSRRKAKKTVADSHALAPIADEIFHISAADNYLELHFADHMVMQRQTLQSAEAELVPLGYLRIHRSTLANVKHIEWVNWKGRGVVVLKNGKELAIGSRYRDALRHFVP